jgi:hypothetical protein
MDDTVRGRVIEFVGEDLQEERGPVFGAGHLLVADAASNTPYRIILGLERDCGPDIAGFRAWAFSKSWKRISLGAMECRAELAGSWRARPLFYTDSGRVSGNRPLADVESHLNNPFIMQSDTNNHDDSTPAIDHNSGG